MKIIKPGKSMKKTFTCDKCGCEFELDLADKEDEIYIEQLMLPIVTLISGKPLTHIITCPRCSYKLLSDFEINGERK
jgi:transcription elongation factor Elf1